MMNRPSATDPYAPPSPPLLPFASLGPGTSHPRPTNQQLWDWDSTTTVTNPSPTANTTSYSYPFLATNSSFLDCPQPLLPMAGYPFYTQAVPEYPEAIKREEERGRIGLNLGQRTYFSSGDAMAIDRLLLGRARGVYALAHQPPRCQAEGCKADLSAAKHYHRRHKVCEFHSKATVVIADGLQQRFCQQCSRFHVLSEFDEAKRSCRKRLADHNRRRRKPQLSTGSSAPKSSATTTNSKDKSQITQKNIKDISKSCKASTSTPAAAAVVAATTTSVTCISNASTSLEEQQVYQDKGTQMRNGPALSLGVVEKGAMGTQALFLQGFPSPSSSSNSFFHHHNLFCSSSNEASQSTGGGSDHTHSHQHSSNLLHLGHAMFEVDFM